MGRQQVQVDTQSRGSRLQAVFQRQMEKYI